MLRILWQNLRTPTRRAPQFLRNFSKDAEKAGANGPEKPQTSLLTSFDKRVLVWTGKYKSVAEVPATVNAGDMNRARDKFRIKVCNYMVIGTILSCILMIIQGKRAAKRGESVVQMNRDFHKAYNEAADEKERKEKQAAGA